MGPEHLSPPHSILINDSFSAAWEEEEEEEERRMDERLEFPPWASIRRRRREKGGGGEERRERGERGESWKMLPVWLDVCRPHRGEGSSLWALWKK
ncbi:hypothetical protein EYF80_058627 [Liparis tanakae]|uniref:Uncharacterized protein n=1 Tax=Liparis tanakae TaxID=230148 RepID=A0A4Z2ERK2_9TELE|nr:hypothetical protein EYF80_058627 [Liparis tanakae]